LRSIEVIAINESTLLPFRPGVFIATRMRAAMQPPSEAGRTSPTEAAIEVPEPV